MLWIILLFLVLTSSLVWWGFEEKKNHKKNALFLVQQNTNRDKYRNKCEELLAKLQATSGKQAEYENFLTRFNALENNLVPPETYNRLASQISVVLESKL